MTSEINGKHRHMKGLNLIHSPILILDPSLAIIIWPNRFISPCTVHPSLTCRLPLILPFFGPVFWEDVLQWVNSKKWARIFLIWPSELQSITPYVDITPYVWVTLLLISGDSEFFGGKNTKFFMFDNLLPSNIFHESPKMTYLLTDHAQYWHHALC